MDQDRRNELIRVGIVVVVISAVLGAIAGQLVARRRRR
jgi:hypothetical protein